MNFPNQHVDTASLPPCINDRRIRDYFGIGFRLLERLKKAEGWPKRSTVTGLYSTAEIVAFLRDNNLIH